MTTLQDCRALDAQDPLRSLRDLFALPEGVIYLDGNSLGVLPRTTAQRVARTVTEEWGRGLIGSWNSAGWFDLPPRVLVRTYDRMPVDRWDPGLAAFAPDTIERLAALGVRLVGIDTASIDPADSKALPSHQAIRRHDLRVLENLVLDDVAE